MNTEKTLTRLEIIDELRYHALPRHYHLIINWKTEALERLLAWYKKTNKGIPENSQIGLLGLMVIGGVNKPDGLKRVMTFKQL